MDEMTKDILLITRLNTISDHIFEARRFFDENDNRDEYADASDACSKALAELSQAIIKACERVKGGMKDE